MKKTKTLLIIFLLQQCLGFSQQTNIALTFSARNDTNYVSLNSIKVINEDRNCDTTLFWPDTVLHLNWVGVDENHYINQAFSLSLISQNPMKDQTCISVSLPESGNLQLLVSDILGKKLLQTNHSLDAGKHKLLFTPGNKLVYIVTGIFNSTIKSKKILCNSMAESRCEITYVGLTDGFKDEIHEVYNQDFLWQPGDKLICVGFSDSIQSGIVTFPNYSESITFQYATNISCPGLPIVDYEGVIYNTIQISSQCWLRENLNVGIRISGELDMADNNTIEKYCYADSEDSCNVYGGLYQWQEMMQYKTKEGIQGICPPGWHLPMDEEWKILEGVHDSEYKIGDPEWDEVVSWRGYDAAKHMRVDTGWVNPGEGTNLYGFSVLAGGFRWHFSEYRYQAIRAQATFHSSTENNWEGAWGRHLHSNFEEIHRSHYYKDVGYSVRCLQYHNIFNQE